MTQTIVLVDDDPEVAADLAEALSADHRRLLVFSDPIRALAALAQRRADLLITDLSMPWLDGSNLVTSARQLQPTLEILLISGYSRGAQIAAGAGVAFLHKPFDAAALRRAVDDALGAGRVNALPIDGSCQGARPP